MSGEGQRWLDRANKWGIHGSLLIHINEYGKKIMIGFNKSQNLNDINVELI